MGGGGKGGGGGGGGIVSNSVSIKIEYRVYGASTWINAGTVVYTNKTFSNFRRIFRIPGLSPNQYEIRVTRLSADPTDKESADVHWINVDEIRNENIAYVNSALLAVRMQADDQISGAIPNISCIVTGKKVKTY